ncbi:MAG: DUF969 domain-containing protein [Alphaproteobacteria bacterium]|nr:DUF969 domain-containing protein [Alphaproteobacteria bacterium]
MMSLIGIPVILVGLVLRFNPLLVVTAAALVTGLAAGVPPLVLIAALGKAFNDARFVSVVFLVLPVIGLMERAGLQARARAVVERFARLTPGRVLLAYMAARQLSAAMGLLSLGGQANMVRPLVAPMTEGAAEARFGPLSEAERVRIRAHAGASDNIGAFFGEDIFVALGSVLLIVAVLAANGLKVAPTRIAFLAIPTALAAFLVHGARLLALDRALAREAARRARRQGPEDQATAP